MVWLGVQKGGEKKPGVVFDHAPNHLPVFCDYFFPILAAPEYKL